MKHYLNLTFFCLLLFASIEYSFAQSGNVGIGTKNPDPSALLDLTSNSKGLLIPRMTTAERTAIATPANGLLVYDTDVSCIFVFNGTAIPAAWASMCSGSTGNGTFNGSRPITANVFTGQNPGTDDIGLWLESLFYPSQSPTASLTVTNGGTTASAINMEMSSPGSLSVTLNWTAARQASTQPIKAIDVNGTSVFTTSPAAGASVSGTTSATVTKNTSKSFTNLVTTTDNKTASATASVNFSWQRYWGFLSSGLADGTPFNPTDAQIISLSQEFASSAGTTKQVTPAGSQRLVIAFPASFPVSDIVIGGLGSLGTFDKTTRSFTNASGGTTSYVIYVGQSNTGSSVTFNVQ